MLKKIFFLCQKVSNSGTTIEGSFSYFLIIPIPLFERINLLKESNLISDINVSCTGLRALMLYFESCSSNVFLSFEPILIDFEPSSFINLFTRASILA